MPEKTTHAPEATRDSLAEDVEKYYVKARVYGAIACRFREALEVAAADGYLAAELALKWRHSERGGVPMTAIDEMDQLLGAQRLFEKILPLVDAARKAGPVPVSIEGGPIAARLALADAVLAALEPR